MAEKAKKRSVSGNAGIKNQTSGKNIMVPDTNVLVQDPNSLSEFLKGGNLIVISWQVFMELDNLKRSKDVGWEAQKVIKKIHALILAKSNLVIERRTNFNQSGLDKLVPDHIIIACVRYVSREMNNAKSRYYGYDKVKLVTNDYGMQVVALESIVSAKCHVDFYQRDITKLKDRALKLMTKNISSSEISKNGKGQEYYQLSKKDRIPYGVPVLIYSDRANDGWQPYRVAVKKGNQLIFIDNNISASNIKAKANGAPNWQQIAALNFLMDDSVSAVFLQGGAGTGKTLLALAAGMHQKRQKRYNQLIVMRPTIYLSDDDNLGFLPGDISQKMAPWFLSIRQNLSVIHPAKKNIRVKESEDSNELSDFAKAGIEIQPLGHIRGSSFENCIIIIEEAQNLPRHMIKTILTRPAKGTKMIFTGDLGQIDNKRLTKESSGLAYAIYKLRNNPLVGIVNFEQTLRSPLASLADRVL